MRQTNQDIRSEITEEDRQHIVKMNILYRDEYKFLTRLLLSLTTGSIVVLISVANVLIECGLFLKGVYILSITSLSLSSLFGVFVQVQMLQSYKKSIDRIAYQYDTSIPEDQKKKSLDMLFVEKKIGFPIAEPNEIILYKYQYKCFLCACISVFVFLLIYTLVC